MIRITTQDGKLADALRSAYDKFRQGDFPGAEGLLDDALSVDLDSPDVIVALKYARYWIGRADVDQAQTDPFDRGEFLLKEWRGFSLFKDRVDGENEPALHAIRQWLFGAALEGYMDLYERGVHEDPELLLRIGRSKKGLGDYGAALEFLENANRFRKSDPAILAELADCYAMVNEPRAAKVFFREAFFIDPGKVDLCFLESYLIVKLVDAVKGKGIDDRVVREWIPVYGTLLGVFSVKRELRPLEYGQLKQAIYRLEQDLRDGDKTATVPRLINHYFWLIDHYVTAGDSRDKVNEILQRMKTVNQGIYEEYVS